MRYESLVAVRRHALWCPILLAVLLGAPAVATAAELNCPPVPARPSGPVPGKDASEAGWKLDTQTDNKGNKLETWCLEANGLVHGGPDFGTRFISADGKRDVWIGACVFLCGRNTWAKPGFEDKTDDTGTGKPDGKPDEFKTFIWENVEQPPGGTKDWHFKYDVATNKLCVFKSRGRWREVTGSDGKKGIKYDTLEILDPDCYDAPTKFEDLKYRDEKITDLSIPDGPGGSAIEPYLAETTGPLGDRWDYKLLIQSLGGTGTIADPFQGFEVPLRVGDTFTIGGSGIFDPFVDGFAALPEYGAWDVSDFGAGFVSYEATAEALLLPGMIISGFGFHSAGAVGLVDWNLASADEETGSSGVVAGAIVPEPSTLTLMASGLLAAAVRKRLVRRLRSRRASAM